MKATILGWSALSGLVLGLIAGLLLFAAIIVGSELLSAFVPRPGSRVRMVIALFSFVAVPLAGTILGWMEGRLKLP